MSNNLRYRVNYGNGQVEYPEANRHGLKAACIAYIAAMDLYRDYAFVEFQDPDTDEWFACGTNHRVMPVGWSA